MRWAEPYGWFVLVLAPLPWWFAARRPRLVWPSLSGFERVGTSWAGRLRWLPPTLRTLAVVGLAVALARPQTVGGTTRIAGQGVAIVAALDQSSSMNAADFPSDQGPMARLAAAKATLGRFVAGRPDDLIGLVVFANYPDLKCPPTLDHTFLGESVQAVRSARPGDDGTNLGDAIALGLAALRASPPKKKVLVLLTDGRNEPAVPRPLDPEEAARLAHEFGITLHTIAIGRAGGTVRVAEPETGLPITREVEGPDLALLERLATLGGGRAFVATDADALDRVFKAIDALEKSPVRGTVHMRYREAYRPWVAAALGLLTLDLLLSAGRLRRLP